MSCPFNQTQKDMLAQSFVESMTELLYVPGVETVVQVYVSSDSSCDDNSESSAIATDGGNIDVANRERSLQAGTTSELQVITSVESTSRNSIYVPPPVEDVVMMIEADLNPSNSTNSMILSRLAQNVGLEVSTISVEVIENPSSVPSASPSMSPSMIPSANPSMSPSFSPSVQTTILNPESSGAVSLLNSEISRKVVVSSSICLMALMLVL